eukprot:GHVO01031769.1.p2 GENE.GHVO01031769.1~~GHVO01031769.1.p2  ORF type:complete len:110 (+),score=11.11 GHVO01031769.1:29-358(+)
MVNSDDVANVENAVFVSPMFRSDVADISMVLHRSLIPSIIACFPLYPRLLFNNLVKADPVLLAMQKNVEDLKKNGPKQATQRIIIDIITINDSRKFEYGSLIKRESMYA